MPNPDIIAGLNPVAADIATRFLAAFPSAILTSGRRSLEATASAEAANTVLNPKFISQTYKHDANGNQCAVATTLQAWVDAQQACLPGEAYDAAFLAILRSFPADELRKFSRHTTGDAFDVHPDGDAAELAWLKNAVAARVAAGGSALFLEQEAGLTRWHVQAW
jgi:hypothetical protein